MGINHQHCSSEGGSSGSVWSASVGNDLEDDDDLVLLYIAYSANCTIPSTNPIPLGTCLTNHKNIITSQF